MEAKALVIRGFKRIPNGFYWYDNPADPERRNKIWTDTVEYWLEEIELPDEEEIEISMEAYCKGGTPGTLDGFTHRLWIKEWLLNKIKG